MINVNKTSAQQIVINELNIRSADRSRKDVSYWRNALTNAESVHNPNRTRLYDLYSDIILDGHLSGVIAKRLDAVLNKELCFETNGARNASFDGLIQSMPFRELMKTILQTLLWGVSGIEFLPGKAFAFHHIPRKHIKPELGIIAFEQTSNTGLRYADMPQVWIMGDPSDLGLLLKCAPYALYKRGGLSDWAQYIELFGQPIRVIKYDSYDEQTRAELKRILDESGSSLSIMLPRQADFEIKDGKQTNCDGNLQLSFVKALNEEMSITILGNTETTTSSQSAGYAQSKVHLEQQLEITRSDMTYTAAMLNSPTFMSILAGYGYETAGGRFVFAKDNDIDYLKTRMEIDRQIAALTPIPAGYWSATYGIPAGE